MSDSDPISILPSRRRESHGAHAGRGSGQVSNLSSGPLSDGPAHTITFSRQELTAILDLYGRKVARGLWRDYAIDLSRDKAVFAVYRRASEYPLYRIEKDPRLARRQGAYSVIAAGGLILKRGPDLRRVLAALEDKFEVVSS